MALRIRQECKTQTPVVAFVLPYWSMTTGMEPYTPQIIGDILKRSGHSGSCEFLPGIHAAYGLKREEWFNPHVFDVGDVHPSEEQFHRKVGELLSRIRELKLIGTSADPSDPDKVEPIIMIDKLPSAGMIRELQELFTELWN